MDLIASSGSSEVSSSDPPPNERATDPLDLGLDPSDPLNLLIHNNSHSADSSMEDVSSSSLGSPPQWSQLSSLWPSNSYMEQGRLYGDGSMKHPDQGMEFPMSLPMDMDFNPSMAVNPSALHFDSRGYAQLPYPLQTSDYGPLSSEMLSASFPFTFLAGQTAPDFVNDGAKPRRLSVTSSSSSGASLSPILEPSESARSASYGDDGADDLAERVRKTAGVMVAVSGGPGQQNSVYTVESNFPIAHPPNQTKAIVRGKRGPTKSSASSSATSSPGPDGVDPTCHTGPTTSVIARPRTSHTTIERRYRTNLNARIQCLRQAVPALRVLEEKGKGGIDYVDERGFVDGVKVARKGSKANVLGKAVEYIRVLKKREIRLKREQNGLKSLICGLVGGPALLKEWEHEWRAKFGGEETDEVEGEDAEPLSDDEEGDDEDGDGCDEGESRAKKKAKVAKPQKSDARSKKVPPSTAQALIGDVSNAAPEKRKRGRPRKAILAEEVSPTTSELSPAQHVDQGRPAQQYLLATFAIFSFFNSPLTSSPTRSHTHSGSVLGHSTIQSSEAMAFTTTYGWRELVQAFHLIVSALVFISIVVPWLPRSRLLLYILSPFASLSKGGSSPTSMGQSRSKSTTTPDGFDRNAFKDALNSASRGTKEEADRLRSALGISTGLVGLMQGVTRSGNRDFEFKQLEKRSCARLGELVALDGASPLLTRCQAYWLMYTHISWLTASTPDLSTLALIIHPLSSSKATMLWSRALKTTLVRPFERLVLESMTVDDATERIRSSKVDKTYEPLGVLASMLIRERVREHASSLFVSTVLPDQIGNSTQAHDPEDNNIEEDERARTLEAALSLGGRPGDFAELLENVWKSGFCDVDDVLKYEKDGHGFHTDLIDDEIRSLLTALMLYRQIFPSSSFSSGSVSFVLSPPPSPSRNSASLHLSLKRALASSAFENGEAGTALEDARDRVVDMLFDFEHASRGRCSC